MKYSVSTPVAETQTQAPEMSAEEFLIACNDLHEVTAEIQSLTGEIKALEAFDVAIRKAHNTLVDFEGSAEAIKVLDLDGQLAKIADIETDMQNLQTAAAAAVEAVAEKVDAALEEQKEGLWAKFKEFCKRAWAAIKRFFGTIWAWLRGLFGHGKLLSWKEAQCVYDMETGFASVAKAIEQAFSDPEFEKAMQNMANEMAKAFEDPKVQEKAGSMDFSGGVTAGTESLKVEGDINGYYYSYKAMQQALAVGGPDGNIREMYGMVLDGMKELDGMVAKWKGGSSEEGAADVLKDVDETFKTIADEFLSFNSECGEVGTMTVDYDASANRFEVTFKIKENKGKTPAQLGWNLKTCREYMQRFNKFCDGAGFNAENVLSVLSKLNDQCIAKVEQLPTGGPNVNKARAYIRTYVQAATDISRVMSIIVRMEYAQAKYITRVLAGIKAEMRKNQKKAA